MPAEPRKNNRYEIRLNVLQDPLTPPLSQQARSGELAI
jgi:hypothetical protein